MDGKETIELVSSGANLTSWGFSLNGVKLYIDKKKKKKKRYKENKTKVSYGTPTSMFDHKDS